MKYILYILIICVSCSCTHRVKKFELSKYLETKDKKITQVDLNKIKPLKKEWPELYHFLEKGHLQIVTFKSGRIETLHSYQFYKFLKNNVLMIYKTPFLQDFENVVSTFANGEDAIYFDEEINSGISFHIVDDLCKTCIYQGIGLIFDKKSRKLIAYGKINDVNNWK